MNSGPWSVSVAVGAPKRASTLSRYALAVVAELLSGSGINSTHFVKS